jgi:hypothetical protein
LNPWKAKLTKYHRETEKEIRRAITLYLSLLPWHHRKYNDSSASTVLATVAASSSGINASVLFPMEPRIYVNAQPYSTYQRWTYIYIDSGHPSEIPQPCKTLNRLGSLEISGGEMGMFIFTVHASQKMALQSVGTLTSLPSAS